MLYKQIKLSNPQLEILKSTKELNLQMSGAGGGKTYNMGLVSAEYIINYPRGVGLIAANTYGQLTKSTLKNIFENWHTTFGWLRGRDYVVDNIPPDTFAIFGVKLKSYQNTICFSNGAIIFTSSLDNYKAIDGTEIAWALLDETKDTKEEAVKEVIVWRLRQKCMFLKDGKMFSQPIEGSKGFNPLYIFTSPARVQWINQWFELDDKYDEISKKIYDKNNYFTFETQTKKVVIYSTYHNEDNLPVGFIEGMIEKFKGNQDRIDMLIYGSPIAKSGGEFFNQFERSIHVKQVEYIPEKNVHISLDFNVTPYITMTCWQILKTEKGYDVRCFDEICLSSPHNNTEQLCLEFKRRYIDFRKEKPSIFYYGDATGSNRTTSSVEHNYQILERVLARHLNSNSNRVSNRNPSVSKTRDFCNKIMAGGFNMNFMVDNKCRNLISDLEFLKEAPDGGKLIVKEKDKNSGQSFEKYGHCFIAGTMITTINGHVPIEQIKVGDIVFTRSGYKKVIRSFLSRKNAEVFEYDFGFTKITCTPEHLFFANGKYKQAQLLTRNDILCIFDEKNKSICKCRLSNLRELNSKSIEENITDNGSSIKENLSKCICIGTFGWIRSEKFRKAIIFIIKTAISPIIILKILNVSLLKNIYQTIIKRCQKNGKMQGLKICFSKVFQLQNYGIVLKRGFSGIINTIKNLSVNHLLKKNIRVKIADSNSIRELAINQQNIVQIIAKRYTEKNQELIMKIEDAFLVARSLFVINTQQENIVQNQKMADVYDLEVEEAHEFFANGILVHNCSDSMRYLLCGAFEDLFHENY